MDVKRFIALRYLHKSSSSGWGSANIITVISGIGVFFTTAALFVVLSAFSGLKTFNINLINKTDPDIRIMPAKGKFFQLSDSLLLAIRKTEGVQSISPVLQEKVFIRYKDKQTIAYLRGIDSTYHHIMPPDSVLISGKWPSSQYPELLMGSALAHKLSVVTEDLTHPLYISVPSGGNKHWKGKYFHTMKGWVSGIYFTTSDFEKKYVFSPVSFARKLLKKKENQISFLDIKVKKGYDLQEVKKNLQKTLPGNFRIADKMMLNKALFKMLNTENLATYFVGTLILIIAVFNIIGAIIILIINKRKDRFILNSLGMNPGQIRKIFFHYGFMLIVLSGILGLLAGLILLFLQLKYGWITIPSTNLVYPMEFRWQNVFIVLLTLLALAAFSAFISSKAATVYRE